MPATMIMLDRVGPVPTPQLKRFVAATGAKAWAFYLGGAGHRHDKSAYDKASLDALAAAGLHLLPIYVGEQKNLSRARGVRDATLAVARTKAMGNRGQTLVADIERRASDPNLAAAVAYVTGWSETVRKHGYKSGVYGAVNLMSALAEGAADFVWPARYIISGGTDPRTGKIVPVPPKAQWPKDPRLVKGIPPGHVARAGQRGWQFVGDVGLEGVGIDVSVVDAAVFPAPAKPAKPAKAVAVPAQKAAAKAPAAKPAARAVAKSAAKAAAMKAPAKKPGQIVVKSGDTLSALERSHGLAFGALFKANAARLDATAKAHGFANSRRGGLIFPGQVLDQP